MRKFTTQMTDEDVERLVEEVAGSIDSLKKLPSCYEMEIEIGVEPELAARLLVDEDLRKSFDFLMNSTQEVREGLAVKIMRLMGVDEAEWTDEEWTDRREDIDDIVFGFVEENVYFNYVYKTKEERRMTSEEFDRWSEEAQRDWGLREYEVADLLQAWDNEPKEILGVYEDREELAWERLWPTGALNDDLFLKCVDLDEYGRLLVENRDDLIELPSDTIVEFELELE